MAQEHSSDHCSLQEQHAPGTAADAVCTLPWIKTCPEKCGCPFPGGAQDRVQGSLTWCGQPAHGRGLKIDDLQGLFQPKPFYYLSPTQRAVSAALLLGLQRRPFPQNQLRKAQCYGCKYSVYRMCLDGSHTCAHCAHLGDQWVVTVIRSGRPPPPGTGCAPTQLWILLKEKRRKRLKCEPCSYDAEPCSCDAEPRSCDAEPRSRDAEPTRCSKHNDKGRAGCPQAHPHPLQYVCDV